MSGARFDERRHTGLKTDISPADDSKFVLLRGYRKRVAKFTGMSAFFSPKGDKQLLATQPWQGDPTQVLASLDSLAGMWTQTGPSENINEFLQVLNVPWVMRKMAVKLRTRQDITVSGRDICITKHSRFGEEKIDVVVSYSSDSNPSKALDTQFRVSSAKVEILSRTARWCDRNLIIEERSKENGDLVRQMNLEIIPSFGSEPTKKLVMKETFPRLSEQGSWLRHTYYPLVVHS